MPKDVLPEFQKYLLLRGLVPEKNVSFYAWWASKFIAFSNNQEVFSPQLLLERFLDHLDGQKHIADWQLRQAQKAGRLQVQDIDFCTGLIFARSSKGDRDRTTILPESIRESLRWHLAKVKQLHQIHC